MGKRILFVLRYRTNPFTCDPPPYWDPWDPYGPYPCYPPEPHHHHHHHHEHHRHHHHHHHRRRHVEDPADTCPGHLSSGLLNSASFVCKMLAAQGYETKLVHVTDSNGIHREIVDFRADVVIVEAFWVPPAKFDELKRVCPKVVFVVRNHSDLSFLSQEGMALGWILEYVQKSNVVMTCNSPAAVDETQFLADKMTTHRPIVYLPNYYPTENALPDKERSVSEIIKIGCFGAIRPLKNQLSQAVAALKFARKYGKILHWHINGTRMEGGGGPILKNILEMFDHFHGDEVHMHDWMPHDEFLEVIGEMDVVTQVSFSETFNIVGADATVMGVPIVVSRQVPWASADFHALPNNSDEIAEKIQKALVISPSANLEGLQEYNIASVKCWTKFLSGKTVEPLM